MADTEQASTLEEAMIKAADVIETRPQMYNFLTRAYPEDGQTPACALGWTAFFYEKAFPIPSAASTNGFDIADLRRPLGMSEQDFYQVMDQIAPDWKYNAGICAVGLRTFVDHYLTE